ncbi:MAG: GntR family transcriptional regulator [Actinobacteria bacterium]|nr:GntR family transcriptional regulator [Actinomycetota bacterium]
MIELAISTGVPRGEKTSVAAARVLREAIFSGELRPGQTLGEEDLARQLGISRTPVREALLLLRGEGLVETPPNRQAAVRGFTAHDLREMHSLRALLEGYAARTAAPNLSAEQITALERSVERYAAMTDNDAMLGELVAENFTFHNTIIEAADSGRLESMIRQTTAMPLIYSSYMTYSRENRDSALQDHRKILAALRDRDPERAGSLMKAHVLWARDVALAHLPLIDGVDDGDEASA